MSANYPKMLYDKDYVTHCDVPDHDYNRAQKKRACTVVVDNPDEEAEKVAEGYRDTYVADFTDPADEPVPAMEDAVTPPQRRNSRPPRLE